MALQAINTATAPAINTATAPVVMDREFIDRNQIVERYYAGKLPVRGAADFERYCRYHPELLKEFQVRERVQAGLKLMEAGGVPLPWEIKAPRFWERLPVFIATAVAAAALGITALVLTSKLSNEQRTTAALRKAIIERPLEAVRSTRPVVILPARIAPTGTPALTINSNSGELVDLKVDVRWSKYNQFHVSINRVDQGQVLRLGNVLRDSNGQLRIAFNASLLGPGNYQFAIEGLPTVGPAVAQAWFTLAVAAI
jgi:hypothetical protein